MAKNPQGEHIARLNRARRGIPLSAETRAKMRAAHLGKTYHRWLNAETKSALCRAAKLGKPNPHTREWNAKISATQKGKSNCSDARRAQSSAQKKGKPTGIVYTAEVREKISASKRGKKRQLTEQWIANIVRASRRQARPTSIEVTVEAILQALGVDHEAQWQIGRYVTDFYIPSRRLVIECDGTYWHGTERARQTDHARDEYLRRLGYAVLRLPEVAIRSGDAKATILAVLSSEVA